MGAIRGAGDRWRAVALALILVTSLVAVGATGPTVATSESTSSDSGADSSQSAPGSRNQSSGPDIGVQGYDESNASTAVAEVTHTYERKPDKVGHIRLAMNYSIPESVDSFTEYLEPRETVVSQEGFVRDGNQMKWDGETATPQIVVDIAINESGQSQYETVDVGEWAFFSMHHSDYNRANLTVTGSDPDKFTAGEYWAFLGNFTRHEYSGTHEDFELIEPAAAEPAVEPEQVFEELNAASELLRVGTDNRNPPLKLFVLPDPVQENGGGALPNELWVHESTVFDIPPDRYQAESVYVHEYVHTRQDNLNATYTGEDVSSWLIEGTASMYSTLLSWRLDNGLDFRDVRSAGKSDVVLANGSTYQGAEPGYRRGKGVLLALDYRIRAATDGDKSFQDVFETISEREGLVNATELQSISETVADREFDTFFDRYVYDDQPYPRPSKPAYYPSVETEPVTVTVSGSSVSPLDRIVVGSNLERISSPSTPGLPPNLADTQPMYASVPLGTSDSVTVPVESLDTPSIPGPYKLYYLQNGDGDDPFPRDGVPDIVHLGTVTAPPTERSVSLDSVQTRRVTARVVNESGRPAPNSEIIYKIGGQLDVELETTAAGEFLNRSGTRGLELGDAVSISADSPTKDATISTAIPDAQSLHVRLILAGEYRELAIVGTAVPESLTAGEKNMVHLLVNEREPVEGITRTVYVDGQPVTDVTIDVEEEFSSRTVPVNLTFETPGTHTIRVGDNPARTVEVAPASLNADFEVTPETPEAGVVVTFQNRSASDSAVESLEWDLDGDGTVDDTGEEVTATFDDPGEYDVTLSVTNEDGDTDTVTQTVTVTERTGPPALPGEDALPQDLDDDGVYEDVTGDGEFTIADVQLYFETIYQTRDSEYVQSNRATFDLTDDSDISLSDVQALFEALSSE
jgi:PKD repeat protein